VTGYWARDSTNGSSCEACETNCSVGEYPVDCPLNEKGLVVCLECGAIPPNATRSPVGLSVGSACDWVCDAGLWANGTECVGCSVGSCDPGYNLTECTPWTDGHCDVECVNLTMPESHSVWTKGCEWGCESGYAVSRLDYVLWVQWECVQEGGLGNGFWEWG